MTEDSSDAHQTASQPCWAELVDRIRQNDNTGLEELYRVFSRGVRFYLCRQLGPQDLDDKVHDTFLTLRNGVPVKWPARRRCWIKARILDAIRRPATQVRRSPAPVNSCSHGPIDDQ